MRVVTRQPVSRRIEQRVLTVLDALEPDQLRALERLALAAAPQVLPVGAGQRASEPPARYGSGSTNPVRNVERPGANGAADLSDADRLTVRLGMLLEEVVLCMNEMRRDNLADRQDRVDDLAVLIDLITTGWRGVDRRLGRIERTLARLDTARVPLERVPIQAGPQPLETDRIIPAPVERPPEPPAEESTPSRKKQLLTAVGTPLLFIAALAIALLTFELLASSSDAPRLEPLPEGRSAAQQTEPATSLSSTTSGPTTPKTGSTPSETTGTTTAASPTAATTTAAPKTETATTTPPASTATSAQAPVPSSPGFRPARVFAWPAVGAAAYYVVRFFRGGELVYQARPATPRLVLPEKFVFSPGSYRWSVRPGFGPRAQKRIGEAIIDSAFVIES
jgi:hypothetical protein